jgi:hypothetical protein
VLLFHGRINRGEKAMGRKRVFQLLLTGRITAAEAERLMAARQASREGALILMGCIGIALLVLLNSGALPAVEHLAHTLRATGWMHGAAVMIMGFRGGIQ